MGEQPTATNQGSENFLTTHIYTYTDLHTALCNEGNACPLLEVSAMSNVSDNLSDSDSNSKCLTT